MRAPIGFMWILKHIFVFGVLLLLAHVGGVGIHHFGRIAIHRFWPMSLFLFKLPVWTDVLLIAGVVLLFRGLWSFYKSSASVWLLAVMVWLVMIGTNALQGYEDGFVRPIVGSSWADVGYWQDSLVVHDVSNFIRNYVVLQPTLMHHSRVHPPGAVLLIWGSRQLFPVEPGVALVLSGLTVAGLLGAYALARCFVSDKIARFIFLLCGLLPAVQIYGLASVDGVIAGVFVCVLWAWIRYISGSRSIGLAALLLWVASSLTFAVAWLVPILLFMEWQKTKKITRTLWLFAVVLILWVLFYAVSGYAYWDSFFVAKKFEGGTFEVLIYGLSRAQDILEPLIFLGPIVLGLLSMAWRPWRKFDGAVGLGKMSVASFFVFIAAGAYYTGETARAALYLVPVLIVSLAPLFASLKLKERQEWILLCCVLGQTVLMQMFGWYIW